MTPQDIAKRAVAAAAVERLVAPGMKLGLGSGSTSHWMVRALGERVRGGLDVVGVATSTGTAALAREVGVRVIELDEAGELDLTLDGADEIDHRFRMIKGGGACLLWEKIVATASRRMVALVDETKVVETLGAFPLPVEAVRFGWQTTRRQISQLLAEHVHAEPTVTLRREEGDPLLTGSGHFLLDCRLGAIPDPPALEAALNRIPGVVENGLFSAVADSMMVGYTDGSTRMFGPYASAV
jgi:ribose 5-phosphate isomerase A